MDGLVGDGRPEVEQMCRLVTSFQHADDVRLESVEELRCVDGGVHNRLSRWVGLGLDVWEEEAQRVSWLGREDREQGDELRGLVVGEICEDEGIGVVLVDSVYLLEALFHGFHATLCGERAGNVLESSNEPLERLLGRLQQQARANQGNEGLQHCVELLVLALGHLQAVLLFALLAEQAAGELAKAGIQGAQLPETVMADKVEVLERLRPGNLRLEQQRLAVRRLLRLEVELVGARGGDGRELLLERGRHDVRWIFLRAYEVMRRVPKAIGRRETAWGIVVAGLLVCSRKAPKFLDDFSKSHAWTKISAHGRPTFYGAPLRPAPQADRPRFDTCLGIHSPIIAMCCLGRRFAKNETRR